MKKATLMCFIAVFATKFAFGMSHSEIQIIPDRGLIENGINLLVRPIVQKNLAITATQKEKILDVFRAESQAQLLAAQSGDDAAILKSTDNCYHNISNLLTTPQIQGLAAQTVSELGIDIFRLKAIPTYLKLTSKQVSMVTGMLSQIDSKEDSLNSEISDKLASLPGAESSKLTELQMKALQLKQKAIMDSIKPEQKLIDELADEDFKAIKATFSAVQVDRFNQIAKSELAK